MLIKTVAACSGRFKVKDGGRSSSLRSPHEGGDGLPDLVRRVLLDEMRSADRDLLLIRPPPAALPLRSGEDRARLGVHEQLRHVAPRQPLRVVLHDAHDVLRLAVYRELPRPCERRAAELTRLEVWSAVDVHLFFGEIS